MEKVLLIGLGSAGWQIDEQSTIMGKSHTYSILQSDSFRICAGVEINSEVASLWEKTFCVKAFMDIESALKDSTYDIIVISTPIPTLFNVLKKCLAIAPFSKIIVEKPVISSSSHYPELVDISEKEGHRILVNLPRLLAPESNEIKEKIGDWNLLSLNGTYSGSYTNTILHVITLVRYWFPLIQVFPILRENCIDLKFVLNGVNLGVMHQLRTVVSSTFDIHIMSEDSELSYKDGGLNITFTYRGKISEIFNSRDVYQGNVYNFIQDYGFSTAVQICGIRQILPGIAQMLP